MYVCVCVCTYVYTVCMRAQLSARLVDLRLFLMAISPRTLLPVGVVVVIVPTHTVQHASDFFTSSTRA